MQPELVTAASQEPVELGEAKKHLNEIRQDFDDYILSLIKAARAWVESYLRQCLISSTWRQRFERFPSCGVIEIYHPPLVSVTSVQYVDEDGATQTLAADQYVVDTNSYPGRIVRAYGVTWPTVRREGVVAPVTVTYVAGRADRAAVPEPIKHAIKLLVGHWYANREEVTNLNSTTMPMAARALLDSVAHGSYP